MAMHKLAHPDGELATARGISYRISNNNIYILLLLLFYFYYFVQVYFILYDF